MSDSGMKRQSVLIIGDSYVEGVGLMTSALTVAPNMFQLFQPMGGVGARVIVFLLKSLAGVSGLIGLDQGVLSKPNHADKPGNKSAAGVALRARDSVDGEAHVGF